MTGCRPPSPQTRTLPLPGATLHYQVYDGGPGPVLLIIQGGAADADTCDALARELATGCRVVTYDRRGLSRSKKAAGAQPSGISTHADDAMRLLSAVTGEPAYVFGSSLGALIGLHLTLEHRERVRVLVAHEGVMASPLAGPDRDRILAAQRGVGEALRESGVLAAARKLAAITGTESPADAEAGFPPPATALAAGGNLRFFLASDLPMASRYQLDTAALQAVAAKVVPAAGVASRGRDPYQCAQALARLLGRPLTEFPGGHTGHLSQPRAFAAVLDRVLRANDAPTSAR